MTLVLLGVVLSARGLPAQSTEEQRARVSRLEDALRAIGRAPERRLSTRATESIRAGALLIHTEPELTALAGPAIEIAWRTLERTLGRGAAALGKSDAVFTLQPLYSGSSTPQGNVVLALVTTRFRNGVTSVSWNPLMPTTAAELGKRIAWIAALSIEEYFGPELRSSWPRVHAWGEIMNPTARANALITLASWDYPAGRACLAGQLVSCRTFLLLDARADQTAPGAEPTIPPQLDNSTVTLAFDRLLTVVLKLGGPQAPQRFRSAAGATIGDRLATAAGVPVDSLLHAWRRDFTTRPAGLRQSTMRAFGALLILTCLLVATTMRRPGVR
ncbi:MAG: hypothetical protein ACREMA_00020 [Longimicrobiales bacterium]